MKQKTLNIRNIIISQLNQGGFNSTGTVVSYSGVVSTNSLEIVTLEIVLFKHLIITIRVTKEPVTRSLLLAKFPNFALLNVNFKLTIKIPLKQYVCKT
jgi:hypothetical protein